MGCMGRGRRQTCNGRELKTNEMRGKHGHAHARNQKGQLRKWSEHLVKPKGEESNRTEPLRTFVNIVERKLSPSYRS